MKKMGALNIIKIMRWMKCLLNYSVTIGEWILLSSFQLDIGFIVKTVWTITIKTLTWCHNKSSGQTTETPSQSAIGKNSENELDAKLALRQNIWQTYVNFLFYSLYVLLKRQHTANRYILMKLLRFLSN